MPTDRLYRRILSSPLIVGFPIFFVVGMIVLYIFLSSALPAPSQDATVRQLPYCRKLVSVTMGKYAAWTITRDWETGDVPQVYHLEPLEAYDYTPFNVGTRIIQENCATFGGVDGQVLLPPRR